MTDGIVEMIETIDIARIDIATETTGIKRLDNRVTAMA